METTKSTFVKIILLVISVCTLAICIFLACQLYIFNDADMLFESYSSQLSNAQEQLAEYKAITDQQLEAYETELANSQNIIEELKEALANSNASVAELQASVRELTAEKELVSYLSSTDKYKAWVAAQSAIEPYDLYNDLSYAYEQFVDLYDNGYVGTVMYDATLDLLVPSYKHSTPDTYIDTLERYFGNSSYHTVVNRLIDDLVTAKLVSDDGDKYSWYSNTLTVQNVMNKLNVTIDVAEALLGLLRTFGWNI